MGRSSPDPSNGDRPIRRFFKRSRKAKQNIEHIGVTSNVQTFYEGPNFDQDDPSWVEYAPPTLPQAKKVKHEGAALQIYKRKDDGPRREGFYIQKIRIQSPFIKEELRETLEKYGIQYGDNVFAESVHPHRGLFFALDKIAELSKTAESELTRSHCELLCNTIEEAFEDTLDQLESLEKEQKITFKLVWTLFPPGSVFASHNDSAPPMAYRVEKVQQDKERMTLSCQAIVFDGCRYGTLTWVYKVRAFDGEVDYVSIPGLPYIDLNRNADLRTRLFERGKKAVELQTIKYLTYKPTEGTEDESKNPWLRGQDHERFVVDPYLYRIRCTQWDVKPLPGYDKSSAEEHQTDKTVFWWGYRFRRADKMSFESQHRPSDEDIELNHRAIKKNDENFITMYFGVAGFSVTTRSWQIFNVEKLFPMERDETVFKQVVLDEAKKDAVKTLVESHKEALVKYDDLIPGKGQCLLIILSGPPGTGKTLMAEAVAEHLSCPLLRADSHYFQENMMETIEGYSANLSGFLNDATEWGGIVLFDEPDFLFQSQESDDRKNLLAFLRHAEYFKGIMFLTTNVVDSIDPAVISRAQIHIRFPSLNESSRLQVWSNFIHRLPEDIGTVSPAEIKTLAKWRINGREIKNILNMSVSWCRRKDVKISAGVIEYLLETICSSATKDMNMVEEEILTNRINGVETNGVHKRKKGGSAVEELNLLMI